MNRALPLLVLLTACFGTVRTVPDAAPDATPDRPEDEEDGDVSSEEPDPAPSDEEVALADMPDEVQARLPADVVLAVRRAKGRFDTATSSSELAAAWRAAVDLAPDLEAALTPAFEAQGEPIPLDLGWLTPHLPGMTETYMAEGTALVFMLDADAWRAAAEKTPEDEDDAFFALMDRAWGSARPMGWASWTSRTWDYGGCSQLGQGVIIEVLTLADAARAAGSSFEEEVERTRSLAIEHVLSDDELFPRCDPRTLQPTDTAAIQGEVDRILKQIRLSDEERAALEARKPALKGQPHTGG